MEIFNTSEESNYEQIVSMGPLWLTEFREMDANYQFAGWTLDLIEYFLNRLVNNQFPRFCDEKTLNLFETLLNIEYPYEPTLEERRRTVDAYWCGNRKMSKSEIEFIVFCYTGHEARVHWEGSTLMIECDFENPSEESLSMLRRVLQRRMPAHIAYDFIIIANTSMADGKAGASTAGMEIVTSSISL